MKTHLKHMTWLFVIALAVVSGLVRVQQTAAQEQGQQNLLTNPGFENGHHHQDGIAEIVVPDGWRLYWLDGVSFPGSNGVAYRPESVVWYIQDAPESERSLFFRDGVYTVKIFKGYAPVYAALEQDVSGLEVGRKYRLVAPVYVDLVENYDNGQKVPPANLNSGFVRLGAGPVGASWLDESQIQYSGYWTAATVPNFYLNYNTFVYEFTATAESMSIWIEVGSRDPYRNSGFFIDAVGLYALDEVDGSVNQPPPSSGGGAQPQPSGPTPTPFPTPTPSPDGSIVHIVQSGDTLWTIAIRYAPALEMTPEQALPYIRELNNNPAFISVGQQLLIRPPQENVPAPEEAAPAGGGEEAPEAEATPEETAVPEPTLEPTATPMPEETTGSICVTAFEDANGNGRRDGSEGLIAEAAFTLFNSNGNAVATSISDSVNEQYCFEDLEDGTYQVQFFPPAGFQATTPETWAMAVSGGAVLPVSFGAQSTPEEVANVSTPEVTPQATQPEADTTSGGLASNLGTILLAAAVVLILVAVAGVVLLRRA
ncbi:MAG: LysM peptidoglycan-binding domain-containing protein [Chloroflexi bacterium]|nr:MAG: LysM peptidoglycan-binding domain-containing protein [Chloroflexota bacterium]